MEIINRRYILVLSFVLTLAACDGRQTAGNRPLATPPERHNCEVTIESPSTRNRVCFNIDNNIPVYSVFHNGQLLIKPSRLGFVFKTTGELQKGLKIVDFSKRRVDNAWVQVWGEKQFIRDYYAKADINLQESTGLQRRITLQFRVYDDGIAFRYIYRQQQHSSLVIMNELTEFRIVEDGTAWWVPAYQENSNQLLTSISAISDVNHVDTPLTLKTNSGVYLSFHEASLVDYASMTLLRTEGTALKADLVPWADGDRVKTTGSFQTPWRTVQIADHPGELISSYLILNLNESNRLADTHWIQPYKYLSLSLNSKNTDKNTGSHHAGNTEIHRGHNADTPTEYAKYYIDYCKKLGIDHLLISGWQAENTPLNAVQLMPEYSYTEAIPGFDLNAVIAYAKSQGVGIVGHHETGANVTNYRAQMDAGMHLYHALGVDDLTIGQTGPRLNMKEWHDSQFGVNYYRETLKKAAKYKLMVNFSQAIKDTGERRTYPNMMTRDGVRGQNVTLNGVTDSPFYTAIIPFTRMLAGPVDFSLGIIDVNSSATSNSASSKKNRGVQTTLAKQLALYVVLYSPVQMLADSLEHYDGHPALSFMLEVPVDWADTKVINAAIGEYVTIARKDRRSDRWYLGSITNKNSRVFNLKLDFLDPGAEYTVKIYQDVQGNSWQKNGETLKVVEQIVNSNNTLTINLVAGGGVAMSFHKREASK